MWSRAAAGLVVALAAVLAAGCGGERAIRIGVLTDCQGPLRAYHEAELAGAEVPFLRRGAGLPGTSSLDGVTPVRIGGRRVELVQGCAETAEHTVFIEEARRLVELDHVDAIVGGASVVTRDVARRYPDVPFVATFWDEQEITLRRPAPNLYRFTVDSSQKVAGLGSYAYRNLGWRRAAVLVGDSADGWDAAAAFTAEFCSLGGTITRSVYRDLLAPPNDVGAEAVQGRPDGVALLAGTFDDVPGLAKQLLPRLQQPLRRHLLLSSGGIETLQLLRDDGRRLEGVVSTAFIPAGAPSEALRTYRNVFAASFPAIPREFADQSAVLAYNDPVEALLQAIERVGGDMGTERERLRQALATLRVTLPRGTVTLDRDRQAVTDVPLVRLGARPGRFEPVGVARRVEQTFGGLLSQAPPPARDSQPCRKATPPVWAQSH
jgi:branched-chain amino acid transport system substrate-binding protein